MSERVEVQGGQRQKPSGGHEPSVVRPLLQVLLPGSPEADAVAPGHGQAYPRPGPAHGQGRSVRPIPIPWSVNFSKCL